MECYQFNFYSSSLCVRGNWRIYFVVLLSLHHHHHLDAILFYSTTVACWEMYEVIVILLSTFSKSVDHYFPLRLCLRTGTHQCFSTDSREHSMFFVPPFDWFVETISFGLSSGPVTWILCTSSSVHFNQVNVFRVDGSLPKTSNQIDFDSICTFFSEANCNCRNWCHGNRGDKCVPTLNLMPSSCICSACVMVMAFAYITANCDRMKTEWINCQSIYAQRMSSISAVCSVTRNDFSIFDRHIPEADCLCCEEIESHPSRLPITQFSFVNSMS